MSGWIKMHRKLLDNPIVCKDSDHLAVWTYLLLNATHKEYPAVFGKEKVMLQPGQLITGRKAISERMRVSESKIQRILSCFESEHQIEQQTGNKNRLVTVLSWSEYQEVEQQNELEMNNKRTTDEQQVNTNKNERTKELKKEDIKSSSSIMGGHNPYSLFEKHEFGKLNEITAQFIEDCINTYTEDWVKRAMTEAIKSSKTVWKYVEGILKRWKATGHAEPWTLEKEEPKQQQTLRSYGGRQQSPKLPVVKDTDPPPEISPEERERMRSLAQRLKNSDKKPDVDARWEEEMESRLFGSSA